MRCGGSITSRVEPGTTVRVVVFRNGYISEGSSCEGVAATLQTTQLRGTARVERAPRARAGEPYSKAIGVSTANIAPHKSPISITTMAAPFVPDCIGDGAGPSGPLSSS
jgi:hypothetical protein